MATPSLRKHISELPGGSDIYSSLCILKGPLSFLSSNPWRRDWGALKYIGLCGLYSRQNTEIYRRHIQRFLPFTVYMASKWAYLRAIFTVEYDSLQYKLLNPAGKVTQIKLK